MGKLKHGNVSVSYPDDISLPEKAGQLSTSELARIPKARKGIGLACDSTAKALKKYGERVPGAGDADELAAAGKMAEDIDEVIADVEFVLMVLKQANVLLDADAHTRLRKALSAVRAAEKFDTNVADLFRAVIEYFSNRPAGEGTPPAGGGTPPA